MSGFVKRLLMITVGVSFMSLGTHLFLVPDQFATGGVTGIAIVVNYAFPFLSVGLTMLLGNIILFVIGLIFLGRTFGILTLYGTMMYSALTWFLETVVPVTKPLTQEPIVNLIFGCLLMGFGLSIVFRQNASSGGTDIIAKILNTYLHIDLGKAVLCADMSVVVLSAFVISVESSLFSALGILMQSYLIDYAIAGSNRRIVMTIISKKAEEINEYINIDMNRGTTIYRAHGGYSASERAVITTVVHRQEYIRIKEKIEAWDPNAFVYVSYVREAIGEGFSYMKATSAANASMKEARGAFWRSMRKES